MTVPRSSPSLSSSSVKVNLLKLFIPVFIFIQVISFVGWFLYTKLLIVYVHLFKSDFGEILSEKSEILHENNLHISANCWTVSLLKLKGSSMNLQQVQEIFKENVLEAKLVGGNLRYPELRQYQSQFMGHVFWRRDPHFRLENHVSEQVYPDKIPSEADLLEEMVNRTFTAKKSPWQMILIKSSRDRDEGCCWLVIRMHHSMVDAKSALKLIVECLGKKKLKTAAANNRNITFLKKFWNFLCLPLNLVKFYGIVLELSEETLWNPFRVKDIDKESRTHVSLAPPISLKSLKEFAKRNGNLQMSAVIMAILTGALRKFLKEGGLSVTNSMFTVCSLPKPNHPKNLTNHFYAGVMKLPLDKASLEERVRSCNHAYAKMSSGEMPRMFEIASSLSDPTVIQIKSKMFSKIPLCAFILSNIAGEMEGFSVGECECVEYKFVVGIAKSSLGAGFAIFSYKDSLQIGACAKASILDKAKTQRLAELVGDEVEKMITLNLV